MKIACVPGRIRIAADMPSRIGVLVDIQAPEPSQEKRRPPLSLVPVVDASGSMCGSKLRAVKAALACLVDHLVPGDRLGLVAFGDEAEVLLPIQEMSVSAKQMVLDTVRSLRITGCTNLGAGLLTGMKMLREAAGVHPLSRVVLLTDGRANRGPLVRAEDLIRVAGDERDGLSVSAFGYGADCDHDLLAGLSDAGGGTFAYIDSEDDVLTAFARELGGLAATYAADVRIRAITPHAGAGDAAARMHVRRLGDLLEGSSLRGLLVVEMPAGPVGRQRVCDVEVSWRDSEGVTQRKVVTCTVERVPREMADTKDDPAVDREMQALRLKKVQDEAEALARAGELDRAAELLDALLPEITDPELRALLTEALMPAFRSRASMMERTADLASTKTYLRGKRQVKGSGRIEDLLGLRPDEAEATMETSFRQSRRRREWDGRPRQDRKPTGGDEGKS